MADKRAGHPVLVAEHLDGIVPEPDLDVGRFHHPPLHGFRRTQMIFPDHHVNLVAYGGQISGFLAGRVAAADDDHVLIPIEKAVAGRAGRNALSLEQGFGLKAEVLGLSPRGDNHGVGLDDFPSVDRHLEGARREIDARRYAETDIHPELLRLLLHGFHQLGPQYSVGKPRKILDLGRRGQLTAGFHTLVKHRSEIRPGGVYGRRIARRTASDDQAARSFSIHGVLCFRFVYGFRINRLQR